MKLKTRVLLYPGSPFAALWTVDAGTRAALEKGMHTEIDPDSIATIPLNKLSVLRTVAREALLARNAIDDCFSSAWAEAHHEAVDACKKADAEMRRLAKDPKTRYGSWRTRGDIELMTLGYL